jgi:hypothetical protein
MNTTTNVTVKGGWVGIFSGSSLNKSIIPALADGNAHGYKVAAVVPDQWSAIRKFLNFLLLIVTLGFYTKAPGAVIIWEPIQIAAAAPLPIIATAAA